VIDNDLQDAFCFLRPNDVRLGYKKKRFLIQFEIIFVTVDLKQMRYKHERSSPEKPIDLPDEVYMAKGLMFSSHLYVAEIQIEEEIC